ncbi:MAG: dipeptidyl-peptidase 3 family protein [Odoribacter splanchnicus]
MKENQALVDFINGFIEVYGDPLAYKASWESVVEIVDQEAGERTRNWPERHSGSNSMPPSARNLRNKK